ncbi:MAG: hypothetical protein JWM49_1153 [Microbacteriaceae bacterium]|nr:hypothetical protein [Microbacteriaceae bacterium]
MFTESDLTRLLGEGEGPPSRVDLGSVIRRSTRRRAARQVALGGATTLAIAGIGVASITGLNSIGGTGSSQSASVAGDAGGSAAKPTAESLNRCGEPVAAVTPAASGLTLAMQFAPAADSAGEVTGSVTLTNTGTEPIVGSSASSPEVTLSGNGVTLWHSNGPTILMAAIVNLAPGQSMTYPARFLPVTCSSEDEARDSFPENLPRVTPGTYQVSAALDVTIESPDGSAVRRELVTGPPADITLR